MTTTTPAPTPTPAPGTAPAAAHPRRTTAAAANVRRLVNDRTCTHPNCAAHGKSPCEGIRCDGTEAPAGSWAELLGGRADTYEMVPRSEVRAGDVVFSSHYGERTVTRVIRVGEAGQVTELVMGPRLAHDGALRLLRERYDSTCPIPRQRPGADMATTSESAHGGVPLRFAQYLVSQVLTGEDCEVATQGGAGRCLEEAVAVRWERGTAAAVCQHHADTAIERGAVVVFAERHNGD